MDPLAQFARARYLNLETYKRDGAAVRTPVWFAASQDGRTFYLYTLADAGKVKRLRRDARARVVPCDFRGNPLGTWVSADGRLVEETSEMRRAHRLLDAKYFTKRIANLWRKLFPKPTAIVAIHPAENM